MASRMKEVLKQVGTHGIAYSNQFTPYRTVLNGVVCDTDLDNGQLVEVYYKDGEAHAKAASAETTALNVAVLMTQPEVLEIHGEQLVDFYNGKDERAVAAYLDGHFRYTVTKVKQADLATLAVGDFMVYNVTTKEYEKKATPVEADIKVFQVKEIEADERYSIDGLTTVEIEVIR